MKVSNNPTTWAIFCALGVPLSFIIFPLWGILDCWTVSEIGTTIAAFAGPLAGLAGFLFIYVNFIQQQNQFERQSFEALLFRLLDHFKSESWKNFPTDPNQGLVPKVKEFTIKLKVKLKDNKDLKHEEIGTTFKEVFDETGDSKIRTMMALVKLFSSILVYIERSKVFPKDIYFELLFGQLTEAEIRAYYYGYFHEGFKLSEEEKNSYRKFFIRYQGRDLIDENHINWIKPL